VRALEVLVFFVAIILCVLITGLVRRYTLTAGVLDVPNSRSSHVLPTPRGGGVAIVLVWASSVVVASFYSSPNLIVLLAILISGFSIAALGLADDVWGLSVYFRLLTQLAASVLIVLVLTAYFGIAPPFAPILVSQALLSLGLVWSINSFNFMDGIDGIAASQATYVLLASLVAVGMIGADVQHWIIILVLASAGACVGFLYWNWPPAKIFMGDVGSGFLGFWLGILAILLHVTHTLSIFVSIALNAVFIADAGVTVVRRILRGDRWYEAHRSHAYQLLARQWNSHQKVTLLLWVLNLGLVSPIAYAAIVRPDCAHWIALGAIVFVAAGCLANGAGRAAESRITS